jgi:hypothetical protein
VLKLYNRASARQQRVNGDTVTRLSMWSAGRVAILTVQAAMRVVAGSAAGTVPPVVIALTEGVIRTMFLTKLQATATALFLAGVIVSGAGVLAQQGKTRPPIQQPDGFRFSAEDFSAANR